MNIDNVFKRIFGLDKPVVHERPVESGYVAFDMPDEGKGADYAVPLITDAMIQGSNPAEQFAIQAGVPGRWSAAVPMPLDRLDPARSSVYVAAVPPASPPPGYIAPVVVNDSAEERQFFKNRSLGADMANRGELISQEIQ